MKTQHRVEASSNTIAVRVPERGEVTLPRAPLPAEFLRWQSEARLRLFDLLQSAGSAAARMNPAHLPVLATVGAGLFPVNLACKGMGLLPKPERLAEFTRLFEAARDEAQGRPWDETLPARVSAAASLYGDAASLDPFLLGGLEIFEGRSFRNLESNPLASLLYVGEAPRFPSYQFDGAVEVVTPGDDHYRFLVAARELFAWDAFHIPQHNYPFGYLFHVAAVHDKTPHPRGQEIGQAR